MTFINHAISDYIKLSGMINLRWEKRFFFLVLYIYIYMYIVNLIMQEDEYNVMFFFIFVFTEWNSTVCKNFYIWRRDKEGYISIF